VGPKVYTKLKLTIAGDDDDDDDVTRPTQSTKDSTKGAGEHQPPEACRVGFKGTAREEPQASNKGLANELDGEVAISATA
jgi:hypothetical protein